MMVDAVRRTELRHLGIDPVLPKSSAPCLKMHASTIAECFHTHTQSKQAAMPCVYYGIERDGRSRAFTLRGLCVYMSLPEWDYAVPLVVASCTTAAICSQT